jgi:uncharacterized SAM-binding protein YcdF (DUF218 family)
VLPLAPPRFIAPVFQKNNNDYPLMNSKSPSLNATEHAVGLDGYFTLLLSNLVFIASAGLYWFWLIKVVYQCAKQAPVLAPNCDVIAVLGMRPTNNEINDEFKSRLNRAVTLFEQGYANKILVVGGKTGCNTCSEAELGVQYLIGKGLNADSLLVEDHSRHTLENLHNAKRFFLNQADKTAALITSRYHLARSHRMAQSLGLSHRMCAAEGEFTVNLKTWVNVLKEAYFIHWYAVNNKKSLNRIR